MVKQALDHDRAHFLMAGCPSDTRGAQWFRFFLKIKALLARCGDHVDDRLLLTLEIQGATAVSEFFVMRDEVMPAAVASANIFLCCLFSVHCVAYEICPETLGVIAKNRNKSAIDDVTAKRLLLSTAC
jgi:hypothetical protein